MAIRGLGKTFLIGGLLACAVGARGQASLRPGPAPVGVDEVAPHLDPDAPDVCATGCSAQRPPSDGLGRAAFERLLERASEAPLDEHNAAYEELLFHRKDARAWLTESEAGPLSSEAFAQLQRELERDEAWLTVRLVNLAGEVRSELGPIAVPLGEKQHLFPGESTGFAPPEISGTVRRVGARHLWTRL